MVGFGTVAQSSPVNSFAEVGHVLGIERSAVPGLHLTVGGEFFHQFSFRCIYSPELEDKVLHGDMLAPYWSNFAEAYDDFENLVEVRYR